MKYVEFIPIGTELELTGKMCEKEFWSQSSYPPGDFDGVANIVVDGKETKKRDDNRYYLFNEYYSCDAPVGTKNIKFIDHEKVEYFRDGKKKEKKKFKGVSGNVKVNFKVLGYYLLYADTSKLTDKTFNQKKELAEDTWITEGFAIDSEGRATPLVKNVESEKEKAKIKVTLEPNGENSLSIDE